MTKIVWCFTKPPKSVRLPQDWTFQHDLGELSKILKGNVERPLIVYPMPWDVQWCPEEESLEDWMGFYTKIASLCTKPKLTFQLQPVDEWLAISTGQPYRSARFAPDSLSAYCMIRQGEPAIELLQLMESRAILQLRDRFKAEDWLTFTGRHFRQVRTLVLQQRKMVTTGRHNRELHEQIDALRYELDRRGDETLVLRKQLEALRQESRLTTQAVMRLVGQFRNLIVSEDKSGGEA